MMETEKQIQVKCLLDYPKIIRMSIAGMRLFRPIFFALTILIIIDTALIFTGDVKKIIFMVNLMEELEKSVSSGGELIKDLTQSISLEEGSTIYLVVNVAAIVIKDALICAGTVFVCNIYRMSRGNGKVSYIYRLTICIRHKISLKKLPNILLKRDYSFFDGYFVCDDGKKQIKREYSKLRFLYVDENCIYARFLWRGIYFERADLGETDFERISGFLKSRVPEKRILGWGDSLLTI